MSREEIDTMWQKALIASIKDNEEFTRYHFAALVAAAERDACAKLETEAGVYTKHDLAAAIRARG